MIVCLGGSERTILRFRQATNNVPTMEQCKIKLFRVKDYMVGLSYLCLSLNLPDQKSVGHLDINLIVFLAMDCVQLG